MIGTFTVQPSGGQVEWTSQQHPVMSPVNDRKHRTGSDCSPNVFYSACWGGRAAFTWYRSLCLPPKSLQLVILLFHSGNGKCNPCLVARSLNWGPQTRRFSGGPRSGTPSNLTNFFLQMAFSKVLYSLQNVAECYFCICAGPNFDTDGLRYLRLELSSGGRVWLKPLAFSLSEPLSPVGALAKPQWFIAKFRGASLYYMDISQNYKWCCAQEQWLWGEMKIQVRSFLSRFWCS